MTSIIEFLANLAYWNMGGGTDYTTRLLSNVHEGLPLPDNVTDVQLVAGQYLYYHYGCDGFDDRGWGCGYRTLMTLCSWIRDQKIRSVTDPADLHPVPSNRSIQETLVKIGDKESNFIGSRQWIGSVEVGYIIDSLYDVSCKIIHVNSGAELKNHVKTLSDHFKNLGAPVMMGGETDVSSKGIMGVAEGPTETYLLVVDPHFWGEGKSNSQLQGAGWIKWQTLSDFHMTTFYNLCLPQLPAVSIKGHPAN
ncbi:ufm1-specific protease 1-like isoform X1 [Macrobrachium rosenbergii]|uniref:ufm1-specific protease 1-like isoform X1 n=2 Tax=Macrobrachium rosenbergii TaxID=79674 RepID=UPI0034D4F449